MRRFRAINLIAFCALVLLTDDNSLAEAGNLRKYFQTVVGSLKELRTLRYGIVPGTLWCGRGSIARNYSDLGKFRELDICCRAHDYCDDYIRPKKEKYGLFNNNICRSSLCECDLQFFDCLSKIHGLYTSTIGRLYFTKCNRCFRTYNIDECVREGLEVNEGMDRQGRRAFCAKFDRNPKWGHRHNATLPKSISNPELSSWDNNEPIQTASRFADDNEYIEDEENNFDEDDILFE